jgi:transposase-like protein
MPNRYPAEFRRRVLDLVREGRSVSDVAAELGIGHQTIYNWRRQDRIDRGELLGKSSFENDELKGARRRIARLEAELAATRRVAELLREVVPPKGSSRRSTP